MLYPHLIELIHICQFNYDGPKCGNNIRNHSWDGNEIMKIYHGLKNKMQQTGIDLWSFCVDVDRYQTKRYRKVGVLSQKHRNITGICLFIRCLLSKPDSSCVDMLTYPQQSGREFGYAFYIWNCYLQKYPNDWSRHLAIRVMTENIHKFKEQQELFVALCNNTNTQKFLYHELQISILRMHNRDILIQLVVLARLVTELIVYLDLKVIQTLFPMDLKLLKWETFVFALRNKNIQTIQTLFDQAYANAQQNIAIFPNFIFALRVTFGQAIPIFYQDIIIDHEQSISPEKEDSQKEDLVIFVTNKQNLAKLQDDENSKLIHFDITKMYEFQDFITWKKSGDAKVQDLIEYFSHTDQYVKMKKNEMVQGLSHIVKISPMEFELFCKKKLQDFQKQQQEAQDQQREQLLHKKQTKKHKKWQQEILRKQKKQANEKSIEKWQRFLGCLESYWKWIQRKKVRIQEFIVKCKKFLKHLPTIKTSLCLQRATLHGCFKVITFCLGELDSIHCFDIPDHSYELQSNHAFDYLMNLEFLVRPNIHDFIYRSDVGKYLQHCDHIALVAEYAEEQQLNTLKSNNDGHSDGQVEFDKGSRPIISNLLMERCRILLQSKFPLKLAKLLKHHQEFRHLVSIIDIFQLLKINIKAFVRLYDEHRLVFIRNLNATYSDAIEVNEKHVAPWQVSCKVKNVWKLLVNPLPQSILLKWIYGMEQKRTLFQILGFEKDIGFSREKIQ